ncbi:DUF6440 family protein [Bacillus thuringiensis]|uniref:DUF6440 family protein n=1 Tax=Bacillus thuringiensis TaxID=1428 RepID=UPI002DBE79DF|nr:DUF6440 family protein [Bacillus thuringiensis]MEC3226217.1 DUF6440 family protein [Bacillus thuringiensis]MEC3463567.1 DUF6440 family protein [Bacillus thuringiensis]MEC3556640.1 DUF6440 family protein [Bacillus thuringiensis]MED2061340.1 DUF6440 family protein [Bacillus thuringiensis]
MKKFLLGFVLIGLVGCVDVDKSVAGNSEAVQKISSDKEDINVFIDKETGCEYLYRNRFVGNVTYSGMTIRLDEQGKPKGCKKISEQNYN